MALSCDFFLFAKEVKTRYENGNIEIIDQNTLLHKTHTGDYIVDKHLRVKGKVHTIQRVMEIVSHVDEVYNIEWFLSAWDNGSLGSISTLNDYVILECFEYLNKNVPNVSYTYLNQHHKRLCRQLEKRFGSLRQAFEFIGVNYDNRLLENNQIDSTKGLIFERIAGEIFVEIGLDLKSQYDLVGDRSAIIDYYDSEHNIGYECKLGKHTAFKKGCESLKKYPQHLDKLFIVYLENNNKQCKHLPENTELIHISKFVSLLSSESMKNEFTKKLNSLNELHSLEYERECVQCGKNFTSNYTTTLYCSEVCKNRESEKRRYPVGKCSTLYHRNCEVCGSFYITGRQAKILCSHRCACKKSTQKQIELNGCINGASSKVYFRKCLWCEEDFTAKHVNKVFCKGTHASMYNAKKRREQNQR